MLAVTPVIFSQDDSWKLFDDTEVDEVHITIDSLRLEWIYENVYSDSLHPSTVRYVSEWFDETLDSVGFRLRGNTSRVAEKKSFKLDINYFEQGRSFYGVEKLNLNGEHNDPSIIRSKICWDLYRDLGMITSRSTHVAVYINDEFYGLYISVEHIDDEFLEKNFSDDSGNLWKCIWPADLTYRGGDPEDYHPYYDDERPYTLKTNKDSYDFSQLARLIGIINQTPDGEFADSLEAVLDVAGVLKYFAMNVLTGGWDDYWFLRNNYYLYHHPSENRFHWIPYDYDNTLGIDWFEIDWTNSDPFNFPVIDGDGRPLAERLMEHDEYRDLYAHFIDFISTNIFELSHWEERMDNLKVNMDPWAETDEYRTYDYGFTIADYHGSFSSDHYENLHVKRGIKEFANLRMGSLPNPLPFTQASPVVYDFSWAPTIPFSDDSIFVSASIFGSAGLQLVEIYFYESPESEPENFPMIFTPVPDTKIVEESDLWTGAIPPFTGSAGYFQIYCEDSNGQSNLFPRDEPVEIIVSGFGGNEFALNEFLSSNDTTNTDESGENDDWLELYNTGTESEDIGGLYLTDNVDNLTKWMIPDGTVIQPQGFLLFWCDEDQDQGELHTNFKLSAGGEFLALVNVDGVTILDSITYGDQSTDISYGRVFDGSNNWDFLSPTPGSTNSLSGMEVSVSYNEGWNLVGLPLLVDNASYLYLFEDAVGGTLYGYNGSYFNTDELTIGNGFWLNMSNESFVVISGIPMNNLSITLDEGWNLISGISLEVAVETIIDPDGIIVPGTFYGFEGTYINSSTLTPGKSYWVNALSAGEVTIGSSLSKSCPEFNDLTIGANELNINGLSLYFGIEIPDKDKFSYRLPPKPPDGVFDVRFKNDRRLEDDFGEIEVINTTETLHITYNIMLNAGEHHNWILTATNGEEYILEGSGELVVPSEDRFTLELKAVVPVTFALHQNFPNPFNPITTLRYDLPSDALVTLSIYDMLGREITQLVNTTQKAGFKSVQWDAKDNMGRPVSAGVYIYQIQAGEFIQTKKMVLLK
jgi:hypothetical protein